MLKTIASLFRPAAAAPAAIQMDPIPKAKATVIRKEEPATLTINANYTTPYRWQVLNQDQGLDITESYTRNPAPERMAGVGGKVTFSIAPGSAKPGIYQVDLGNCRMGSLEPVATKSVTVQVENTNINQTIHLARGESSTIELGANYTTPFIWRVTDAPEGINVTTRYVSNPNMHGMVGVGGKLNVTMTNESAAPGKHNVVLGHFYVGDDARPIKTHTVEVVAS